MWVKVKRDHNVIFVGALYHPSNPLYEANDFLDYIEASAAYLQQNFADAPFILAGDLKKMSDNEFIIRTGISSLVTWLKRLNNNLEHLYVSYFKYSGVTVVQSVATIVATRQSLLITAPTSLKSIKRAVYVHSEGTQHHKMLVL